MKREDKVAYNYARERLDKCVESVQQLIKAM